MSGTRSDATAAWHTVPPTHFRVGAILNGANFSFDDAIMLLRVDPNSEIEDAAAIACKLHNPAMAPGEICFQTFLIVSLLAH